MDAASPALTTPGIERAVARLLGADATVAVGVVDALGAHGRLGDGVLLIAMLGASRWGTDATGALGRVADGDDPPAGWSDYELRIAGQEAAEEGAAAIGRLTVAAGAVAVQNAEQAADALRDGAATVVAGSWPGEGGAAERDWVARLCARAGARLVDDESAPAVAAVAAVPRGSAYLDLLG